MLIKRKKFNKKASLEISIQAIVIVVLAMTLLGLGLGFIKGMFTNITRVSDITFDKIADQLQQQLTTTNQKLIFSQPKISLSRGQSDLFGWGIRNDANERLDYAATFRAIRCPETECVNLNDNNLLNQEWFTFKYDSGGDPQYFVDAGDQAVERVDLSIPKDAKTGLYLISFEVYDDSAVLYATTDIFVTVT